MSEEAADDTDAEAEVATARVAIPPRAEGLREGEQPSLLANLSELPRLSSEGVGAAALRYPLVLSHPPPQPHALTLVVCLLYTSDAADD